MSEVTEEVKSETPDFSSIVEAPDQPEVEVKKEIIPITDPLERVAALQEIEVLTKFIGTTFIYPKFSKGNGNKIKPELTGSTKLSYFSQQDMAKAGERVLELMERLVA